MLVLEAENIARSARSWWQKLISQLIAYYFRICQAQPLEQRCCQLSPAHVAEHFHRFNSLSISEDSPRLGDKSG
jgi:hypothetical protein